MIKNAIEKHKNGDIVHAHVLDEEEFSQIKKFLALLIGKHKRNGISFSLIAQCLEIDPEELDEIYLMIRTMREVKKVSEPPPGYKWKLVKEV